MIKTFITSNLFLMDGLNNLNLCPPGDKTGLISIFTFFSRLCQEFIKFVFSHLQEKIRNRDPVSLKCIDIHTSVFQYYFLSEISSSQTF